MPSRKCPVTAYAIWDNPSKNCTDSSSSPTNPDAWDTSPEVLAWPSISMVEADFPGVGLKRLRAGKSITRQYKGSSAWGNPVPSRICFVAGFHLRLSVEAARARATAPPDAAGTISELPWKPPLGMKGIGPASSKLDLMQANVRTRRFRSSTTTQSVPVRVRVFTEYGKDTGSRRITKLSCSLLDGGQKWTCETDEKPHDAQTRQTPQETH